MSLGIQLFASRHQGVTARDVLRDLVDKAVLAEQCRATTWCGLPSTTTPIETSVPIL